MGDTTKLKAAYQEAIDIVTGPGNNDTYRKVILALAKEDPALLVQLYRDVNCNFTRCNVVLDSYGNSKIPCIKAVRQLTGMGLKEAKDFVESELPRNVLTYISREEGEKTIEMFRSYGNQAHLSPIYEERV